MSIECVSVGVGVQVGVTFNVNHHPDAQHNNSVQCMVMFMSACMLMPIAMVISVSGSDCLEQASVDLSAQALTIIVCLTLC